MVLKQGQAEVAEPVDAGDLKSPGGSPRAGSSPALGMRFRLAWGAMGFRTLRPRGKISLDRSSFFV